MIRPQPNHLILRALFTPCRRATLTTADDLALSKAISRQDRGGGDFGASALGGNFPPRAGRSECAAGNNPLAV